MHAWLQGLGTSTKDEAREYFSNLMRHRKEFIWEGASRQHATCCAAIFDCALI